MLRLRVLFALLVGLCCVLFLCFGVVCLDCFSMLIYLQPWYWFAVGLVWDCFNCVFNGVGLSVEVFDRLFQGVDVIIVCLL